MKRKAVAVAGVLVLVVAVILSAILEAGIREWIQKTFWRRGDVTPKAASVGRLTESKPSHKPLAARNPKPDQDKLDWSETDHQVFELLKEDRPEAIREAMDLIWEEVRQPEPWLIEMRRRLGVTNVYAPVGPGLNLDVVNPAQEPKNSEQP